VAAQKPEFDRGWAGLVGYTTTLGKPTAVQRVDCGPRSGWTCYKADSEGAASPPRRGTERRHPFENLFLRAADRGDCRSRVADRGLSIESVSSCQTAARALMCRLAGAPHAAAERAAAPLAPSTWSPTACGVPAERDPVSEHVVPTRRGELTRAHRAISTLAPRAAGPRPTGSMWRTCSCSAVVVARSLAELVPLIRPLLFTTTPGVPPSAWARPDRCRARTPAGEVYGEGMKERVATDPQWWASLPVFAVWRLAPVAWRFGPTHACQGVGCCYCGACVPTDGRGSCGRGRWGGAYSTPCFEPAFERMPWRETATRGRAPFAPPRADEDPSPGAMDIYKRRDARSCSWLWPY